MADQPLYPYREATNVGEQPSQQPSQYQQPQYPQSKQPQYPQPQYPQPQYPQAQTQYPAQQPQGYPSAGYAGMGYGMPVVPSNTLATVALALGILGALVSLFGYIMPNMAALVLTCVIALPALVLGVAGIRTSRRMGGLKFGHALTGAVLGAFSVVLFCVLASSRAGGMSAVISGGGDDPDPIVTTDPQEEDDPTGVTSGGSGSSGLTRQTAFADSVWTGFIDPNGGDDWNRNVSMGFSADSDDGLSGSFVWMEDNGDWNLKEKANGRFSIKFGSEALEAAKAGNFSMDPIGGEDFATYIMGEDGSDLVYIELSPSESQSDMLIGGQQTKWFGYIDSGSGYASLDIYRQSDKKIQFFNIE